MDRDPGGHLDDVTAHAWLDGALSRADAAEVEAHVQACDACAETVARARGMIAAASRILGALDEVPVHVMPARARRRGVWWGWPVRAAAALVVVAGGTVLVTRRMDVQRPAVLQQLRVESKAASPPGAVAPVPAPVTAPRRRPALVPRASAPARAKQGVAASAPAAIPAPVQAPPSPVPSPVTVPTGVGAPMAAVRQRPFLSRMHARSDTVATTGPQCFDVVAPESGAVARRIVLDTGHAALVNATPARWRSAGPDSVTVASIDGRDPVRVEARIVADSMMGAASAPPYVALQVFTAKKCGAPKSP